MHCYICNGETTQKPMQKLITPLGGRPSGREVVERRESLELCLKEGFEIQEGHEISVESVMSFVGFDSKNKLRLSRTVKKVFPGVYTRRENKGGNKQYPLYKASID